MLGVSLELLMLGELRKYYGTAPIVALLSVRPKIRRCISTEPPPSSATYFSCISQNMSRPRRHPALAKKLGYERFTVWWCQDTPCRLTNGGRRCKRR